MAFAGTATIKPATFTPGVQVGAYLTAKVRKEANPPRPIGTAAATATVASDGSASFTGLADADYSALETPQTEVRSLTIDASGGTCDLTVQDETYTAAFNVAAATLKTALVALFDCTASDLNVSGGPGAVGGGTPYVITFAGAFASSPNVPAMTADSTNLTGGAHTATIATTTAGRAGGEHAVRFHPV